MLSPLPRAAVVGLLAIVLFACGSDDPPAAGTDAPAGAEAATTGARDPTGIAESTTTTTQSAPSPTDGATTTAAPAPTTTLLPATPRVLLVGDSTLLAVKEYGTLGVLRGMDPVYEAASCRALAQRSCGDNPPANSVTVIDRVQGAFDVVVVMAGYDEWFTTFADSFDRVVASARAKGAKRIVWLTYPENVDYLLPDDRPANDSLVNMNLIMGDRVATGEYPDVVVADWRTYTAATQGWYSRDDIHLSRTGAYAVADYISRKVAAIGGAACPAPREVGGDVETPCPDPDVTGPVPDVVALYQ